MSVSQALPTVFEDVSETMRTNFVGFASFTILVWDHVITFSDEVEYIWKGKKGPIIYLFLLNRYFTPLGFIINLYAYLSPSWTFEVGYLLHQHQNVIHTNYRCRRFIRYEGCTVAIAVEVVGLMMLLRISALYPTRKWITVFLAVLLVVETAINVWLISRGEPVLHNAASGVHACSMIFDPAISAAASASAWYPLLYDSIVFALTVNRTLPAIRKKEAGFILRKLLEDGLLYYSVIFAITFVLTFMIVGAPPGIKNICAQMEQLITVAMMSRITLSLRKAGQYRGREASVDPNLELLSFASESDFNYQQSAGPHTLEDDAGTSRGAMAMEALPKVKSPPRLVLHGRSPIQFAIPQSSPHAGPG